MVLGRLSEAGGVGGGLWRELGFGLDERVIFLNGRYRTQGKMVMDDHFRNRGTGRPSIPTRTVSILMPSI